MDSDTRLLMSEMRKDRLPTHQRVCLAVNKTPSEENARRALTSNIVQLLKTKQENRVIQDNNIKEIGLLMIRNISYMLLLNRLQSDGK